MIFLLVVIHELLHLVFIPDFLKSKSTSVGLTIFGGFVYTEEEISKPRYILVTIAPFIILSVALPLFLGGLGWLTPTLKFVILLNALASSVDILNLIILLTQVPKNGKLRSNGMKTYWKKGGDDQNEKKEIAKTSFNG
ncbi:DUF3267 domain-containing protein [Pseudalkalibacillus caeni]|uniref:DUF3267 domain-containing protein n=1 Tax=Exobacillus caeni TaxID=2574798 RepID=UPI001FE2A333|nr:DUF3267 domain-containing protein [Pseudalkalibacillus caeni]